MATQQSMDTVQKAYIGYYGRPADPAGLTYWADRLDEENGDLSALINEFGTSDEYTDRFDGMDNETLVNNLYQQLFNRDAEQEGLDFYVAKLENAESSLAEIAIVIMDGAQNSDAVALENKLEVAQDFTAAIEAEEVVYGEHQIDEAVELIEAVDAGTDLSTINVDDIILNFPGEAEPNTLFTLTQNTETVVTDNEPEMQLVTYWGYNPHEHGETDVDNTDGYDPDGNDSNLTNETISDGGVPLWQLIQTVETITGLDFFELGLIDAESTTPDLSAVTNLTVDGGDNGSTSTIQVTLADGTLNTAEVELADEYVEYLHDILFDAEGNSRLFQKEIPLTEYTEIQIDTDGDGNDDTTIVQETYVDPGTTSAIVTTPIVLTPNTNNGFTVEDGQTNDADNMIVAGRLDLLHGAYIDGGDGYNTLEVDAKGHFAQPQELLNIQAVTVENLPNIYTQNDEGNTSQYPSIEGVDSGDANSILDLSRATDLEVVTITEGTYDNIDADVIPGALTVVGVRGNATVVLEGSFDENVTVHFSEGAENGTDLVLNLGEVKVGTVLQVLHNSETLNIDSIGGGNTLTAANLGSASLMNLNVSGDAKLQISGTINSQFAAGHPATIDASANTAGVDLELSNHDDDIVFTGTAASDDQFIAGTTGAVVITGGEGNSEFTATADEDITITAGNGNNKIVADSDDSSTQDNESVVTVTVGNGDNDIDVDSDDHFVITAGDGANRIEADAVDTDSSVTDIDTSSIEVGNGHNEIDASAVALSIVAGDGGNEIEASADEATITTGTGNDVISVTAMNDNAAESVTVNAGEGNNTVTVSGFETVAVTTGSGDDMVTIIGGNQQLDSADGGAGALSGENGNETLINVDLGAGTNTLTLGADSAGTDVAITAIEGSVIAGDNVTLKIESNADLTRADISAVSSVQLTDSDDLTVTSDQYAALGASAFSVLGASFGASAVLTITVSSDMSFSDIVPDTSALPAGLKFDFVVADGATFTITAEQLHYFVMDGGIEVSDDDAQNQVVVTEAGLNFDVFDRTANTDIDTGGSLDDTATNDDVTVIRSVDGFNRPSEDGYSNSLTIDTDSATDMAELASLENLEAGQVDTLVITGSQDFNFAGSIDLDVGFAVDFSGLTGALNELTITQFEKIADADTDGNGTPADGGDALADIDFGMIIGREGVQDRVNVEVSTGSQTGWNDITAGGIRSQSVETFIVTDILAADGSTQSQASGGAATLYVCDQTEGLETIGLQNNRNAEVTFKNVNWNTAILLEGDGYENSSEQEKNLGNPDLSEIGSIIVEYFEAGANASVLINNQGQTLGMSEDAEDGFDVTETRTLVANGIEVVKADRLTIDIEDGNAVIEDITAVDAERIILNSANDVSVNITAAGIDTDDLVAIDASGVAGTFTLNLTNGTYDLSGVSLTGIDALVLGDENAAAVELTLTATQLIELKDVISDTDSATTLNVVGLTDEALNLTDLDVDTIGTVTFADVDGTITVNTEANFDDATSLTILAEDSDTNVVMTAEQFNSTTDGTVNVTEAGDSDATLTLTDLANDETLNLDLVSADADIVLSVTDLTATDDMVVEEDGGADSITLAVAGVVDLTEADLTGVPISNVELAEGSTLTLTAAQVLAIGIDADADDVAEEWAGLAGSTLNITDLSTQALDLDLLVDAGITIGTITIDNTDNGITIDPTTTFGNATEIVTPTADDDDAVLGTETTTVTMTADQFAGLEGVGTISGGAEISLTGLENNADGDDADLAADNLEIDLSGITAPHGTLTLGGSVTLNELADLGSFEIILSTGQVISFATEAQATGTTVTETGAGANTAIAWLFDAITAQIDTSNYDGDINTLFVNEDLVDGENIEELWNTLDADITVEVVNSSDIPDVLVSFNRTVVVEAMTGLESITIDDQDEFQTIENLTVNLEGNTNVGNIVIDDTVGEGTFNTLTINSYEDRSTLEDDNDFDFSPNIVGNIGLSATPSNELVKVVLDTHVRDGDFGDGDGFNDVANGVHATAERDGLELEVGTITFGSQGDNSSATLTLEGDEDITIAGVDISDTDITILHIDNNNAGTVTIAGINQDDDGDAVVASVENIYVLDGFVADNDVLATGDTDVIQAIGDVDLTGTSAVNVDVEGFIVSADATITLTAAQIIAIGEANFFVENGANVTVNVTELGNAAIDLNVLQDAGFNIGAVTTVEDSGAGPVSTALDETTTLGGADSLTVLLNDENNSLRLTAEQFNQISGNLAELDSDTEETTHTAAVTITDLADIEGDDGLVDIDLSTVTTTGTKTVEADDADATGVDITLASTADLADFILTLMSAHTAADDVTKGQTIRFATAEQAERTIEVLVATESDAEGNTLGAGVNFGTNVVWLFDDITGTANGNQVDVSGYDSALERLWVLESLVNDANVEDLFASESATLDGDIIIRVVNEDDLASVLPETDGFDRQIEIETYSTIGDLTFSDIDDAAGPYEFVESLEIDLGGDVTVGDITVSNILGANVSNDDEFTTLTINSRQANSASHYLLPEGNDYGSNPGEIPLPSSNVNTVGDLASGSDDFDLNTVVLTTGDTATDGSGLDVGTIFFSDDEADTSASLTITGTSLNALDGDVTIEQLDISDENIIDLTVTTSGFDNVLVVTGGSPGVDGGAAAGNTDTITLVDATGASTVYFGYVYDEATTSYILNTDGTNPYAGISGESLTTLDLSLFTGAANLGVIALVDSDDFTFTGNAAATITATLGQANVNGAVTAPELDDSVFENLVDALEVAYEAYNTGPVTPTLSTNLENAYLALIAEDATANGSADHTTAVAIAADIAAIRTDYAAHFAWDLNLNGTTLTITDDVDFTAGRLNLTNGTVVFEGDVDLSNLAGLTGTSALTVGDGDSITLTAEVASGLTITGLGTVNIVDLEDFPSANLSLITTSNVNAALDLTDGDVDLSGNLGTADITVSGGANTVTVSGTLGTATFSMGTGTTLDLTAAQADTLVVDGLGAVTIQDLGVTPATDLSSITATTVTAVYDTDATTFTGNFGTAVVTVGDTVGITGAASVFDGANLISDGAGANAADVTITGDIDGVDLSGLVVELIDMDAVTNTDTLATTFPTLTAEQTLNINAAAVSGETITGVAGSTLAISALGAAAVDFSNLTVDTMTANVPATAVLDATTDLGAVDVVIAGAQTLTATGAQVDGLTITEAAGAVLILTDLSGSEDLSNITVTDVQATITGGTVDLSDLTGLTVIEVTDGDADPATGASLTLAADQFGALNETGGGEDSAVADFADVAALTVDVEYEVTAGSFVDVDITVDTSDANALIVSGNAAGLVQARDDDDTDAVSAGDFEAVILAATSTVTHTDLGSFLVFGSGVEATAGVDTFEFNADADITDQADITSFSGNAGDGDKIDLSALGDTDNTATTVTGALTTTDLEVYFLSGDLNIDTSTVADAATAIDGAGTWTDANATAYVVITDDGTTDGTADTSIYRFTDTAGSGDGVVAGELELIGTVNGELVLTDIIA